MGLAEEFRFQPTGELVIHADEVEPVLKTLRSGGLEVEVIHNHWIRDEPQLFYVHFWAVDDAQTLAQKLAAALDKVHTKKD